MSRKPRSKVQKTPEISGVDKPTSQAWAWILLTAVALFTAVVRIRLLQTPLERDEGEFGYMGQLILQGIPPYKIACNMKLPGTYAMYALFLKIFGNSVAGIHLGLMTMNLISIVLVFLLARRLLGPLAAVVAGASFGLLSVIPSVLGTSAHATQYVLPFALGGIILMLRAIDSGKTSTLALSGLLLGISFLMKQHAVFFLAFALLYFIRTQARKATPGGLARRAGILSAAMALPFAITCLILIKLGVFQKFWFWTFTYAGAYTSENNMSQGLMMFRQAMRDVTEHSIWLWVLGGMGLTSIAWGKRAKANGVFLVGFLVFSFLTMCPGMYFRPHYFIAFLPALSLLIGAAVSSGADVLRRVGIYRVLPIVLFTALLAHLVFLERGFLFEVSPSDASIIMYDGPGFVAMEQVGEYVRAHTKATDKIVMFGSDPELYFYAQRRAGTTFLYTYGLVEIHKYAASMQQEMMKEIMKSQPEIVVISNLGGSWLVRPGCDRTIFNWANAYFPANYEAEGIAEFLPRRFTAYMWGDNVKGYAPRAKNYLLVIRRLHPSSH